MILLEILCSGIVFHIKRPKRWVHSHPDHVLQSSDASEGIICYNEAETWNNHNSEFAVGQTSMDLGIKVIEMLIVRVN